MAKSKKKKPQAQQKPPKLVPISSGYLLAVR
jgi:hypothetical protein